MPKIYFRDDADALFTDNVEVRGNGWIVAKVTHTKSNNHRVIPKDRVKEIVETGDELEHVDV